MVGVEEATRIIFSNPFSPKQVTVPLWTAPGRILAESIVADRPFPPFDRVAMDGVAIAFRDFEDGTRDFPVQEVQAAGQPAKTLQHARACIEVMTGAILPKGTDTVIRYEDLLINNRVATIQQPVVKGQNVHVRGIDASQDEVLVRPGMKMSPAEVALLASVGKSYVKVIDFPRAAIISTGNELIDIDSVPLPHQIRRSNVFAIQAGMKDMNWAGEVFHINDDENILNQMLHELLQQFDVLILSGGVSKGKFDFIPSILEKIGVRKIFHQVNQRPGKPFWFGKSDDGKTVFALPGNPVSTFLCFYRYIKPWVLRSAGLAPEQPHALLNNDFTFHPALTYFLQVTLTNENGVMMATPVVGGGSGDFANLKEVTGFLELPADKKEFKKGEVYPYIPFRE
jgi:molybdopterin molybdotransferase